MGASLNFAPIRLPPNNNKKMKSAATIDETTRKCLELMIETPLSGPFDAVAGYNALSIW